jgi:hypothetical protein
MGTDDMRRINHLSRTASTLGMDSGGFAWRRRGIGDPEILDGSAAF